MQNYLCKRLHNHYRKLPFHYAKSTSYRLILDKNGTDFHLDNSVGIW